MDNMKEAMDALTGGSSAGSETEDFKTKYEESQRRLQSAMVEQGRVAKLDAEKKALERELAELKAKQKESSLVETLTQSERELVDPAIAAAAAKIANAAVESERRANEERFARLESERAAAEQASQDALQRAFMARVEQAFPGFLASVGPGGQNKGAWDAYLVHNRGSVVGALNECDFGTVEWHIKAFCKSIEIPDPSAGGEAVATPAPGTGTGVKPAELGVAPGRTYTQAEYDALEKKAVVLRAEGNYEEYRKLADELDKIIAEDRVKG